MIGFADRNSGREQKLKRESTLLPLTRIQLLSFGAAGSLIALTAAFALTAASTPARADELTQNLGPVGHYEPILMTVGS
jgi:hypothetical protein